MQVRIKSGSLSYRSCLAIGFSSIFGSIWQYYEKVCIVTCMYVCTACYQLDVATLIEATTKTHYNIPRMLPLEKFLVSSQWHS